MALISTSISPAGRRTVMTSPTLRFIKLSPSGERKLMRPFEGSASSGPTTWYVLVLPFSSSSSTVAPKRTLVFCDFFDPHHLRLFESLGQEAHAAVDLAEPLLTVGVLGVLGAIALRGGVGDLLHDARALDV